jgi:hypothetical protein
MINKTLYLISCVTVGVFMSSCSTYGPAFQGHQLTYMETPDPDIEPTNKAFKAYASGSFGTGATYQPQEKNVGGSISAHLAWSSLYQEEAIGVYFFAGEYRANVKSIEKSLMYRGMGIKTYRTWLVPINDVFTWQMFGGSFALQGEGGNYTQFRDTVDAVRNRFFFNSTRNAESPLSLVAGITTGLKMRLKNEQFINARYMFGGASSSLFLIPEAFFHQFTINYQCKKTSIYLSLVRGDVGRNGLNTPFQLGVSLPLHFD